MALYRKYRPQIFAELVGQNHIKTTLQNELATGKVAHAYLFSGPRGLGKTTVARLLAKAVNCLKRQAGESEPCNQCDACKEIVDNRSLDVIEIDAASNTGVDNVRENIIGNSRFTPTSRKYKVFIIDEVHMLSLSAFNALLKTLEEPPPYAIFILATTEIHRVPPTIISRCQRFDFRKVGLADVVERLNKIVNAEKRQVDQEVLISIARKGEGTMRDAESLLGQILSLGEEKITLEQAQLVIPASSFSLIFDLLNHLIKKDLTGAITLINRLVQEGVDLPQFTDDLIEILRKILLIKIGGSLNEFTTLLDQEFESQVSKISKELSLAVLTKMIETFVRAKSELKSADIIQLPLELSVIEICGQDNQDNAGGGTGGAPVLTKSDKPIKNPLPPKSASPLKAEIKAPDIKTADKIKLTIEQVKEKWDEVLTGLKKYNQVLASTLHLHRPTAVKENGTIEISFKYRFYQQRINDAKNLRILEETLEQVFKLPLRIETVIVKELPQPEVKASVVNSSLAGQASVDSLLQTFGGQLIE